MELTILEATDAHVRAGYSCPCGCTPSVQHVRDAGVVGDGCCCGNQFALGPQASATLKPKCGFQSEVRPLAAPWGEQLEAAWLVGASVHDHADSNLAAHSESHSLDPVCGMTVDTDTARAKGLQSSYGGAQWFFCGKGCKLDFDEDPERFLDPGYVPSM